MKVLNIWKFGLRWGLGKEKGDRLQRILRRGFEKSHRGGMVDGKGVMMPTIGFVPPKLELGD